MVFYPTYIDYYAEVVIDRSLMGAIMIVESMVIDISQGKWFQITAMIDDLYHIPV